MTFRDGTKQRDTDYTVFMDEKKKGKYVLEVSAGGGVVITIPLGATSRKVIKKKSLRN